MKNPKQKPKTWKGFAWFASKRAMKDPTEAIFYDTEKEAEGGYRAPGDVVVPATITLAPRKGKKK